MLCCFCSCQQAWFPRVRGEIILKQLFNLYVYKTKNQNIALFVKISILVWASSNPMGQVQNTLRLPLGLIFNTVQVQIQLAGGNVTGRLL